MIPKNSKYDDLLRGTICWKFKFQTDDCVFEKGIFCEHFSKMTSID